MDYSAALRKHSGLVHLLATQAIARLPHNVERDDLVQVGMIGLLEAIKRYDPAAGVTFATFASHRIRGAMLDEMRCDDWLTRDDRFSKRRIDAAVHRLQHRLLRGPAESEIASELHLSLLEYQALRDRTAATRLLFLEDLRGQTTEADFLDGYVLPARNDPAQILEDSQTARYQAKVADDAIALLPQREQEQLTLRLDNGLNGIKIAQAQGVSESRVSQLHKAIVAKLRASVQASEALARKPSVLAKAKAEDADANAWLHVNVKGAALGQLLRHQ